MLGTLPLAMFAKSGHPNIIYIMCDDMGYGDLGCYGQKYISTPCIDRMAEEGMRFTQAYAGCPVSAPSRCSFMTGQHTGHAKIRGNKEYWGGSVLRQNMFGENADYYVIGQEPYDMTHPIIPELFKAKGYRTGMFGKWAGGYWNYDYPDTYAKLPDGNTDTSRSRESSSCSLPNLRGIDCYYGPVCQFQAHTYYPNFLNRYDPEGRGDTHLVAEVMEQNIHYPSLSLQGEVWRRLELLMPTVLNTLPTSFIAMRSNGSTVRRRMNLSSASSPTPCLMPSFGSRMTASWSTITESSLPARNVPIRQMRGAGTMVATTSTHSSLP